MRTRISIDVRSLVLGAVITLVAVGLMAPITGTFADDGPSSAAPAAAAGNAFNYQGRLELDGVPANGSFDFRFTLHGDPVANAQVGPQLAPALPVVNGLFSAQLDFGTNAFDGNARWLAVDVKEGASYVSVGTRQPLTPAPYALFALSGGTQYTALPASGLTLAGTTFGIDTSVIQERVTPGCPANSSIRTINANGSVDCESDDSDPGSTYSALPGGGLMLTGPAFSIDPTLVQRRIATGCAADSSIRTINEDGTVDCETDDASGPGTTYTAAPSGGLFLSGNAFSVDTSAIQRRINGNCNPGSSIRSIAFDGSVVCETDDSSPSGWNLFGNAGTTASNFIGTTDNVPFEIRVNNLRGLRIVPGLSPTFVGGSVFNFVDSTVVGATIGGGGGNVGDCLLANSVRDNFGTVAGGCENKAGKIATGSAKYATVGGGLSNSAEGSSSTVGGGFDNFTSGTAATISGGGGNLQVGNYSVIGGGQGNAASFDFTTIAGGQLGFVSAANATIGGGYLNKALGASSTVSGGSQNQATVDFAAIAGGLENLANGQYAGITGGQTNTATGEHSFVGGGKTNTATADFSVIAGGALNSASGIYAAIGGGRLNSASAEGAQISGGVFNFAGNDYATIGGGEQHSANGQFSTIGGGSNNNASLIYATVGGGRQNRAEGSSSTVAGGFVNSSGGTASTVGGGADNSASGERATVPGGDRNLAAGPFSFAAGRRAKTSTSGSFVWADSNNHDYTNNTPNNFSIRATGGVFMTLAIDGVGNPTNSCSVQAGDVTWTCTSDRNRKENFAAVEGRETLAKLAEVPITRWTAKDVTNAPTHMGPMAQDFHAAFGLGDSNLAISTIDLDGVALSAIKGLHEITTAQDERLAALEAGSFVGSPDEGIAARLAALEARPVRANSGTPWLTFAGIAFGIFGAGFGLGQTGIARRR